MLRIAAIAFSFVLSVTAAEAREIFSRGSVSCTGLSPDVTELAIGKCHWKVDFKKRGFSGSCTGTLLVNGVALEFLAAGEMTRIDEVLPDNDDPLAFTYSGLAACTGKPKIMRSVHNCRLSEDGLGQSCDVCIRLARVSKTYCYAARASVAPASNLPVGMKLTPNGLVRAMLN
jgi:hypothetical protein